MRWLIVTLAFLMLAAPAQANLQDDQALTIARGVWHNPCVDQARIQRIPFGGLAADARGDRPGCTLLIGDNITDWESFCTLVIHEAGHLAGYRDPTNTTDPVHSSDPDSVMHSPMTRLDPRCTSREPWVFVLAGQSNMAGRGLPLPPADPDSRIMEFTHHGNLVTARDPLNHEQGAGPGLPFARALLQGHPERQIILVQCAKGSTSLRRWERGGYLFKRCARLARSAAQYGDLRGVLFAQGESDAQSTKAAGRWGLRYTRFVGDFRKAVEAPRVPFAHTILATTTQPRRFHAWRTVQAQQRRVRVPGDVAVPTVGLPLQDNVHFTVDGYRTLGERFAGLLVTSR